MSVAPINRPLDQELTALVRGVSLECLVCGEFVLKIPERFTRARSAGPILVEGAGSAKNGATIRRAGRVTAGSSQRLEESPDTAGQGRWGIPRRRKPTESGTERRPPASFGNGLAGKGETVG